MMGVTKDKWAYLGHRSDFRCNLIVTVVSSICFVVITICMGLLAIEGDDRWIVFGLPMAFMGSCVVGFWCATLEHWKWMKYYLGDKE